MCISYRTLRGRQKPFLDHSPFILDSGGFSELKMFGKWTVSPQEYVDELHRLRDEVGLDFTWAAQQDWMCEPFMVEKTGLSVREHQRRTVENFVTLRDLAPDLPIIPVVQGMTLDDYDYCIGLFNAEGFDLTREDTVGVGSVCRRQNTHEIGQVFRMFSKRDISVHGFGVKMSGLERYGHHLKSADSLAWATSAVRSWPKRRCVVHQHLPAGVSPQSCSNCRTFALEWREKVMARLERNRQHYSIFDRPTFDDLIP